MKQRELISGVSHQPLDPTWQAGLVQAICPGSMEFEVQVFAEGKEKHRSAQEKNVFN